MKSLWKIWIVKYENIISITSKIEEYKRIESQISMALSAIFSIKEKIDLFGNVEKNNEVRDYRIGILSHFANINENMYKLYLDESEKMLRGINLLLYVIIHFY